MLHSHLKLPAGGALVLLAFLLHVCALQAATLPRQHRLRGGGEAEARRPGSDMAKALEYLQHLRQRGGGGGGGAHAEEEEQPAADYDEVDKVRVLLQLAARQEGEGGEGARDRQVAPARDRQVVPARGAPREEPAAREERLVEALLRSLQAATPVNDRRGHRHSAPPAAAASSPGDYGNFPRPHKKYPLMFEDEENGDAYKRATEELDEQYTPQSLANLRSIFDELGRMSATFNGHKRDGEDEDDEEAFSLRNLAYEDVAGGEDWMPVEEKVETEEMVDGSHQEYERALQGESSDEEEEEEEERGDAQRRAAQSQEDADDDTKLVDYYLLKVLEMTDQTQKRDNTGEQRKRLIRPALVDPRTVKELLELSLKLHVPPQDLIDMLITEELRKLHRHPQASSTHYRTGGGQTAPKIRYFSRRLPVKAKNPPEDMDREDFLDIIGVETISNEYPVRQRPLKPASSPARGAAPAASALGNAAPAPAKLPAPPTGRRENLFLSELNKMPLRRQADDAEEDDDDDDDVEDEVTTYLAAKILTEYPNTIAKRDTQARLNGQFPYELYEQAVKDYLEQADTDKSPQLAKRETDPPAEETVEPTESQVKDEIVAGTEAPQAAKEDVEHRGKPLAGM